LKAAIYYCDNYELILDIITPFDKKYSVYVENSQKYLNYPDVAPTLVYLKSNFITLLEARKFPLSDGIDIIKNSYLRFSAS
jgi:hypothetical protein